MVFHYRHGVLLAGLGAAGCIAPRIYFKLPVSASARMIAAVVGTAIFLLVALPLLTAGWRMLHFVTLLPIILVVGFILRGVAPAIDATQSARPVAQLLQQMDQPGPLPLATFALSRNTAFALAFYLDRRVAPYEGLEISPAVYELPAAIPASAHILIAREDRSPPCACCSPDAVFACSAPTARSASKSSSSRLRPDHNRNRNPPGRTLLVNPAAFTICVTICVTHAPVSSPHPLH